MRMKNLGIRGWGDYAPEKKEMFFSSSGRQVEVNVANDNETTFTMARLAVCNAIQNAGLINEDLENQFLINCNEAPPDYLFQLPGRMVLDELKIDKAHSFNITQGGNSALFSMYLLGCHLIAGTDNATRGVVCAPSHWRFHSKKRQLGEAVLTDGAAALIIERGYPRNRILSIVTSTETSLYNVSYTAVGGSLRPFEEVACKSGQFVYSINDADAYARSQSIAPARTKDVCERALRDVGAKWEDVTCFVLAAAFPDLEQRFINLARIPPNKIVRPCLPKAWSCSSSMLFALSNALSIDTKAGDLMLATSVGLDGNYAAAVLQR